MSYENYRDISEDEAQSYVARIWNWSKENNARIEIAPELYVNDGRYFLYVRAYGQEYEWNNPAKNKLGEHFHTLKIPIDIQLAGGWNRPTNKTPTQE